ncbi:MAG: hypothetical protein GXP35_03085 [Actinobacteria bacterium]|nr:hypothetical protein [Actinomycetota bacterium]
MILDAGVFIALDNPAQRGVVQALIGEMIRSGEVPVTNEAVLAQVWRGPAKQVPLGALLSTVSVRDFGDAKTIGRRCAVSRTSDVVDASLAVLADQLGMKVLTTDPGNMASLGAAFVEL